MGNGVSDQNKIEVPKYLIEVDDCSGEIVYHDNRQNKWARALGFYAPSWYGKKAYLKNVAKWDRIIRKWGHSEAAFNELWQEGDEKHGIGFEAYMGSFRREQNAKRERELTRIEKEQQKEEKAKKVSKLMQEYQWNIKNEKAKSLLDIMQEQENEN